ncbi:MAG: galactokinase [Clostridia bacterium]|nr:galactokinase [Clostridia bacterium]
MRVTLFSRGYEKPFILDLGTLIPKPTERGTSFGIIRGIAAGLNHERKFRIGGFDAVCDSLVARGSGLSSSAAFEVLASVIFEGLYNERFLDPVERAKLAQNAENQYFGKACGLLDQLACSCGSMALYDFAVPKKPQITTIDFDFHAAGYSLMVVNTGDSHTMLTPHYNDIITEMQAVAKIFRANTLRRVEETAFYEKLPAIRERAGDRAALRAMHYFQENRRVEAAAKALQARNIQEYLKLINESGRSSENLLQNVYADAENQALALGLALSARILQGKGAWRVHGGGFAGTVQAYVPHSLLREYTDEMERVFGEGCCETLRVTNTGGREFVIRQ